MRIAIKFGFVAKYPRIQIQEVVRGQWLGHRSIAIGVRRGNGVDGIGMWMYTAVRLQCAFRSGRQKDMHDRSIEFKG